jgi:ABC-2 type transport system ATP-binding protein
VTHLALSVLRALPNVLEVHADRDAVVIHTSHVEEVLRQLLRLDLEVSDIEVSGAGLEDAFLALTKNDAEN